MGCSFNVYSLLAEQLVKIYLLVRGNNRQCEESNFRSWE